MTAVSLFSSGGIGDLAVRRCGFEILVSCEKIEERHAVFAWNFPSTRAITGDIWQKVDEIVEETRLRLRSRPLSLLYATPPCQGMSKNGRGKLLSAVRAGLKPEHDERNRLILPTLEIARRLQPEVVLFENVPEMANTLVLDEDGTLVSILDLVSRCLGSQYAGCAEVVEFADYGVPQCRQRLITVFTRHSVMQNWHRQVGTFMPPRTHSPDGEDATAAWVSVRDAIEGLPHLDAASKESAVSDVPYHRVPVLDKMKYWWVKNTAPGKSAFDNQCSSCGFDGNPAHSARRDNSGINRASRDTPLYCVKCSEMLPRPSVERNGRRELMRGYTSAYKRMLYDRPASALTRNLSYACSDNKLHPEQNRVLSLYEAFRIHSLDKFEYEWRRPDGKKVSDKTVREIIGESIPPAGLEVIVNHIQKILIGNASEPATIGPLFANIG